MKECSTLLDSGGTITPRTGITIEIAGCRVLHFGEDGCHRVMVLRRAGYMVQDCHLSLEELAAELMSGIPAHLVCITQGKRKTTEQAILLARGHSYAPIVLFRKADEMAQTLHLDAQIETLTAPGIWLAEIEELIRPKPIPSGKNQTQECLTCISPADSVCVGGIEEERGFLWESLSKRPLSTVTIRAR